MEKDRENYNLQSAVLLLFLAIVFKILRMIKSKITLHCRMQAWHSDIKCRILLRE